MLVFGATITYLLVRILKKPMTIEQKTDADLNKISSLLEDIGTSAEVLSERLNDRLTKITEKNLNELEKQIMEFNSRAKTKKYPALRANQSKDFDFCIIDFEKVLTGDGNWVDIFVLKDKGTGKQFIGNSYGGLTER